MAYYKLRTQISKGEFKGKKVEELVIFKEGQNYLLKLHIGYYNVWLSTEVFIAISENVKKGNRL